MEKFWGTKKATGSVWCCFEQTGPPLSFTPWSGGLLTFILSSFLSLSPSLPYFKRTGSPSVSSPFASALKRCERRKQGARSAAQLLINMQISDSLRALITQAQDYECGWFKMRCLYTHTHSFTHTHVHNNSFLLFFQASVGTSARQTLMSVPARRAKMAPNAQMDPTNIPASALKVFTLTINYNN